MVIDVELTLNRWAFEHVEPNKIQIGCIRIAWWPITAKHAVSFEVNWRRRVPTNLN